jgi:hypothetical protein
MREKAFELKKLQRGHDSETTAGIAVRNECQLV